MSIIWYLISSKELSPVVDALTLFFFYFSAFKLLAHGYYNSFLVKVSVAMLSWNYFFVSFVRLTQASFQLNCVVDQ